MSLSKAITEKEKQPVREMLNRFEAWTMNVGPRRLAAFGADVRDNIMAVADNDARRLSAIIRACRKERGTPPLRICEKNGTPASPEGRRLNFCSGCGYELRRAWKARFCPGCGFKL